MTILFLTDSKDAIKVRLSLKAAMGEDAVSVINDYQRMSLYQGYNVDNMKFNELILGQHDCFFL